MKKTIKKTLSVVLATKNEEDNIGLCLDSVKTIAGEIIVLDEHSTDKTREIAKERGAKVFKYAHKNNFHETKQAAIEKAKGDWILQLDADERATPELVKEINEVISSDNNNLLGRTVNFFNNQSLTINNQKAKLFVRHQQLIKEREGSLGKQTGEVVAFFVPRVNFFVGKPLIHAGVYPDGVIRLFKRGKARLPAKSVHELMEVDGEVGWLFSDLEHHESPTLSRYIARANRYTDITAKEMKKDGVKRNTLNLFKYSILLPISYFLRLYVRHRGYKDGIRGFLWSAFSALHHPLAYWKYWVS